MSGNPAAFIPTGLGGSEKGWKRGGETRCRTGRHLVRTGPSAPDQSEAWAELLPDDRLQVWIGAADMGQGAETLFWQVAAETMGFPLERVQVCTTDTRFTPDGNFSAGSRQTYVSGRAVQMAVEELKKTMNDHGAAGYDQMKATGLPTPFQGGQPAGNDEAGPPKWSGSTLGDLFLRSPDGRSGGGGDDR